MTCVYCRVEDKLSVCIKTIPMYSKKKEIKALLLVYSKKKKKLKLCFWCIQKKKEIKALLLRLNTYELTSNF